MRKIFHQYFRPTETELRELWDDGLFSFDASVLLNIYGYSKDTREDVVDLSRKTLSALGSHINSGSNTLETALVS